MTATERTHYTVAEISGITGLSESLLYRELDAGSLPFGRKAGSRWAISAPAFDAWWAGRAEPVQAANTNATRTLEEAERITAFVLVLLRQALDEAIETAELIADRHTSAA